MENILEKLQNEVGLTKDQAMKTLSVLKDFMDKENIHIDWNKFFKGKYENMKESISTFFSNMSDKAEDFGNKISDKVGDISAEAKRKIKDVSKDK